MLKVRDGMFGKVSPKRAIVPAICPAEARRVGHSRSALVTVVPAFAARRRRQIARAAEGVVRAVVAGIEVPTAVVRGMEWLARRFPVLVAPQNARRWLPGDGRHAPVGHGAGLMTLTLSPASVGLVGTLPRKTPVTVSMTAVAGFSPRLLPS
jgi:hypothetical protein